MNKEKQNRNSKSWLLSLLLWGGVFLVIFLIRYFLIQSYSISTTAMQDTLQPGDFVLVNKVPQKNNPGRNRVVLFASPLLKDKDNQPLFVGRCVGMPGDTLEVTAEGYLINGSFLPRPPQALNEYLIEGALTEKFSKITHDLKIPRRKREVKDCDLYTILTSFEEYLIREELTPEENALFKQLIPETYRLVLPQKNNPYPLDSSTIEVFKNAILSEVGEGALFSDGKLFIQGKEKASFTFRQNYYWLLSDNSIEAVDSRYLGVIPQDHIKGNVWLRWFSKQQKQWFKFIR